MIKRAIEDRFVLLTCKKTRGLSPSMEQCIIIASIVQHDFHGGGLSKETLRQINRTSARVFPSKHSVL